MTKIANSQLRLRGALKGFGKTKSMSSFPSAFCIVVWELMKAHTRIDKLEKLVKHERIR